MKKVTDFIGASYEELTKHVTWPKTSELYSTTALVLVATVIFALLIGLIDYGFQAGMDSLYKSFINS
ncbi:MAG: preprotein translocase subunit SecE [Cytophagaceae bacterium]|jgi:preprotein translocase subunit SecE|nr:preprotein translocase subunit SecE [Cytophagaceae bacterium]